MTWQFDFPLLHLFFTKYQFKSKRHWYQYILFHSYRSNFFLYYLLMREIVGETFILADSNNKYGCSFYLCLVNQSHINLHLSLVKQSYIESLQGIVTCKRSIRNSFHNNKNRKKKKNYLFLFGFSLLTLWFSKSISFWARLLWR